MSANKKATTVEKTIETSSADIGTAMLEMNEVQFQKTSDQETIDAYDNATPKGRDKFNEQLAKDFPGLNLSLS